MRPYNQAVKPKAYAKQWADICHWMRPPHHSVAEISQAWGIDVITLYKWRKAWRLQGEVVPASQKDPEGWGPAGKCTVVQKTDWLNSAEHSAYYGERGPFPVQVDRWRKAVATWPWPTCRWHLMPISSRC